MYNLVSFSISPLFLFYMTPFFSLRLLVPSRIPPVSRPANTAACEHTRIDEWQPATSDAATPAIAVTGNNEQQRQLTLIQPIATLHDRDRRLRHTARTAGPARRAAARPAAARPGGLATPGGLPGRLGWSVLGVPPELAFAVLLVLALFLHRLLSVLLRFVCRLDHFEEDFALGKQWRKEETGTGGVREERCGEERCVLLLAWQITNNTSKRRFPLHFTTHDTHTHTHTRVQQKSPPPPSYQHPCHFLFSPL